MCGIAGIITSRHNASLTRLQKMTDAIAHRGPDGEGHWISADQNVALGHRRLSILDTSESGAQPMHYGDRYTIIFNGEIYNYLEIREKLLKKGYSFKSGSDTEVLLALYDDRKEQCLQEVDGMFAFVIYDALAQTVFLARDRFGEKPLFYSITSDGAVLFASEMKAIWAAGVSKDINQRMLYNYFSKNLLENPANKKETFYQNIYRFPASHYVLCSTENLRIEPLRYWDLDVQQQYHHITEGEAALRFQELMHTSVSRRLRSDVPLGSSLSGGLDSSLIVCLLDEIDQANHIVRKTFSAQFPGFEKDESRYQQMVIQQCHVEPHFVYPTADSMLANLQKVMHHQEEPFGSASICVQYEVFGLARQNNVTVLLDGQGADEILAGYHSYYKSYFNGLKLKDRAAYRTQLKQYHELHADNAINVQHQRSWKDLVKTLVPEPVQEMMLRRKRAAYSGLSYLNPDFVAAYGQGYHVPLSHPSLSEALYFETMQYGLEVLLRYADRNSMAHSREVRLPFLYHELVAFLFALPDHFKIRDGWTKWIMRRAFDSRMPKDIAWRKDKIGYEPPQQKWLELPAVKDNILKAKQQLIAERMLSEKAYQADSTNLNWKLFSIANTLYAK